MKSRLWETISSNPASPKSKALLPYLAHWLTQVNYPAPIKQTFNEGTSNQLTYELSNTGCTVTNAENKVIFREPIGELMRPLTAEYGYTPEQKALSIKFLDAVVKMERPEGSITTRETTMQAKQDLLNSMAINAAVAMERTNLSADRIVSGWLAHDTHIWGTRLSSQTKLTALSNANMEPITSMSSHGKSVVELANEKAHLNALRAAYNLASPAEKNYIEAVAKFYADKEAFQEYAEERQRYIDDYEVQESMGIDTGFKDKRDFLINLYDTYPQFRPPHAPQGYRGASAEVQNLIGDWSNAGDMNRHAAPRRDRATPFGVRERVAKYETGELDNMLNKYKVPQEHHASARTILEEAKALVDKPDQDITLIDIENAAYLMAKLKDGIERYPEYKGKGKGAFGQWLAQSALKPFTNNDAISLVNSNASKSILVTP
jgi:hypothetical protein